VAFGLLSVGHNSIVMQLNKASCRFNGDGDDYVVSKEPVPPHSAVSSDIGSPQLGRTSPFASDRININKLMASTANLFR